MSSSSSSSLAAQNKRAKPAAQGKQLTLDSFFGLRPLPSSTAASVPSAPPATGYGHGQGRGRLGVEESTMDPNDITLSRLTLDTPPKPRRTKVDDLAPSVVRASALPSATSSSQNLKKRKRLVFDDFDDDDDDDDDGEGKIKNEDDESGSNLDSSTGFLAATDSTADLTRGTKRSKKRAKPTFEDEVQMYLPPSVINAKKETLSLSDKPVVTKEFKSLLAEQGLKKEEYPDWLVDIKDSNGRRPGEDDYDASSLYIPPEAQKKMSDFEKQYWDIKSRYFDTVVFFKKGKFYELYERDADLSNREFDMRVSGNARGIMRMTGVPEMAFEDWAMRFVARGYKVAKVDQVETMNAKYAREKVESTDNTSALSRAHQQNAFKSLCGGGQASDKVLRRQLTTVLTAGTLISPTQDLACYTMAIYKANAKEDGSADYALCFADTSTAQIWLAQFTDTSSRYHLEALLVRICPKEIIVDKANLDKADIKLIRATCPGIAWNTLSFAPSFAMADVMVQEYWPGFTSLANEHKWMLPDAVRTSGSIVMAACGLLGYLQRIRLDAVFSAKNVLLYNHTLSSSSTTAESTLPTETTKEGSSTFIENSDRMVSELDGQTLLNLDVLGSNGPCLYFILEHCYTPMGKRLLRKWVCHPLCRIIDIKRRQNAVLELGDRSRSLVGEFVANGLRGLPDLERLSGRIQLRCAKRSDVALASRGFSKVSELITQLSATKVESTLLTSIIASVPSDLQNVLQEFAAGWDLDTGVPNSGCVQEYDEAVAEQQQIQVELGKFLGRLRREYGGNVQYVDVGKQLNLIELPVSIAASKIPATWRKVSATKSVARYTSPEVTELNEHMVIATETINAVLLEADQAIQAKFSSYQRHWRAACAAVSELDALCSLAIAADTHGFECVPEIVTDESAFIEATGLRHPCYAASEFIANNITLNNSAGRGMLLTGPNMGGKSTQLRTVGLAVVLAQLGCKVPAASCRLAPFDAVYTRIGARDNLIRGHSTFYVELNETASIMRRATRRSLVLMDELGRGTSTYDGHAIAVAVLHALTFKTQACVMFATHYAGMAHETRTWPLQHKHMACQERPTGVAFLYRLVDGVAPRSHGMNVARMAGVPDQVVKRAGQIAAEFDTAETTARTKTTAFTTASAAGVSDLALFAAILSTPAARLGLPHRHAAQAHSNIHHHHHLPGLSPLH